MDIILNIGLDTLTNGLAYAILALGVFISFRVFDFESITNIPNSPSISFDSLHTSSLSIISKFGTSSFIN